MMSVIPIVASLTYGMKSRKVRFKVVLVRNIIIKVQIGMRMVQMRVVLGVR